jgi:hypothetical protein
MRNVFYRQVRVNPAYLRGMTVLLMQDACGVLILPSPRRVRGTFHCRRVLSVGI